MNLAVFDVDGTLLDNLVNEDACYLRALREQLALPTLDTDWVQYENVSDDGIATEAYFRQFGQPLPVAKREATIGRFVELLQAVYRASPVSIMRGAPAMLAALESRGWAVALATGAWRRAADYKLGSAGLCVTGIPLATSEDGPARVAIVTSAIARAAARFGVKTFAHVVSIGDGVWDVNSARELALPFVGVGGGEQSDRLRFAGASHVLTDYYDVELALRALQIAQVPRATF